MIDARRLFACLVFASLAIACDAPTDSEQCRDIERFLESRERQLNTACESDNDCQVVFVRPDTPIAASESPDGVLVDRMLREWSNNGCAPFDRFTGIVNAVCEPILEDVDNPDAGTVGGSGDQLPERVCNLRGDVPPIEVDVVDLDSADAISCDCEDDRDCGGGEVCACTCVSDDDCGLACASAFGCGQLRSLGLGVDGDVCVASCEALVERDDAAARRFTLCLQDAPCDGLEGCLDLAP